MAKATTSTKQSKKATQDAEDKAAAEARKKEAEEKKAAEKKAKEEEREAKKVAREEEKQAQVKEAIDSGKLIKDGDTEFWESEKDEDKDYTLDERAVAVLEELKGSEIPLMGKDIQEKHGGGYPLYIPMFSMLKALGLIKEYRRRTGERGGGGKAYLYVGK